MNEVNKRLIMLVLTIVIVCSRPVQHSVAQTQKRIVSISWNCTGTKLVTVDNSGIVSLLDAKSKQILFTLDYPSRITDIEWQSNCGSLVAIIGDRGRIGILDSSTMAIVHTFSIGGAYVNDTVWLADGFALLIPFADGIGSIATWATAVWSPTTKRVLKYFDGNINGDIVSIDISPDSSQYVIGSAIGYVTVVDFQSGQPVAFLVDQEKPDGENDGRMTKWSPNGKYIATLTDLGLLTIWDTKTWQSVTTYDANSGFADSISWRPDSRMITIGVSNSIRAIEIPSGRLIAQIASDVDVDAMAWAPNSQFLAFSASNQVSVRDAGTDPLFFSNLTLTPAATLTLTSTQTATVTPTATETPSPAP